MQNRSNRSAWGFGYFVIPLLTVANDVAFTKTDLSLPLLKAVPPSDINTQAEAGRYNLQPPLPVIDYISQARICAFPRFARVKKFMKRPKLHGQCGDLAGKQMSVLFIVP